MNLKNKKKKHISRMFDSIAHKYDFLNHFLSFGIDKYWRATAINILKKYKINYLLDIATGTGDFAIEASKIPGIKIEAVDISENMLAIGREKIIKMGILDIITFKHQSAESLHYPDNSFDAVTVAFGVRNFENLNSGLSEMYRVLKPGGIAVILEFSKPKVFFFRQLYYMYFRFVLPFFGKLVSKDKTAYKYLPESVYHFPDGKVFTGIMKNAGFSDCGTNTLTFGIATVYTGKKK